MTKHDADIIINVPGYTVDNDGEFLTIRIPIKNLTSKKMKISQGKFIDKDGVIHCGKATGEITKKGFKIELENGAQFSK